MTTSSAHNRCYSIQALCCAVADEAAIEMLLEDVPDADWLRLQWGRSFAAQHWSPESGVDFWFFSNGIAVTRLVFEGLEERQAECVWAKWWERVRLAGGRGRLEWLNGILREVTAPAMVQ